MSFDGGREISVPYHRNTGPGRALYFGPIVLLDGRVSGAGRGLIIACYYGRWVISYNGSRRRVLVYWLTEAVITPRDTALSTYFTTCPFARPPA